MKVAIAHRSHAVLAVLVKAVEATRGGRVAWTSSDGHDTVARCADDPPDVLLLDVDIAGLDAVEVTRRIMRDSPGAIILVTPDTGGSPARVFDGMGAGALDAVPAPWIGPDGRLEGTADIARKVRFAATLGEARAREVRAPRRTPVRPSAPLLVAIGASTGGPPAVARVLSSLPRGFRAAVAVIQHVDARFTADLAGWLGDQIVLPIRVAREGDGLEPGVVTLAGRNEDLALRKDRTLAYQKPGDGMFYHPSVDVFFASVAEFWPRPGAAALLTGIGRDGAAGLLALRKKGWRTLAQDEATCVVYGMPKAAATLQAAMDILPIDLIGTEIARFVDAQSSVERGDRE